MANLKTGSSGSEVKKLQQTLVDAGYDVGQSGADGIFGKNTAAAVKQYQKDNGLAVDGIAGKNTLGSLYGTSNSTASNTSKTTPATTPAATEKPKTATSYATEIGSPVAVDPFTYADYAPSEIVQQANTILQQHKDSQPGAYQSQWQDEINDYLNQIQNRDPFSYDMNADALYQQYKDNYIQQGKMAMMDTMGQAAALTGGYGNTYAQNAGQQAYNQQLSQLNNIMPQLYQMAFDRYAYEGQQLQDNLSMYMGMENQDYNRYQTDVDNWYTQLQYLTDQYNTEQDRDYKQYETGRQEAYGAYTTEQDRAWDEYLTDKKKEQSAAEIMAGAGNYDRLGEVYGLSEDEIAALKKANEPKVSSSNSGSQTKKYKDIDVGSTAYNTMMSEVRKVEDINGLRDVVQKYLGLGYDPEQVNALTAGMAATLTATDPNTTDVDPMEAEREKRRNGGGRSGLGTVYATIK
jgi:peptidoglycan hydrolase-like protein with peptidoglycan-binding domain